MRSFFAAGLFATVLAERLEKSRLRDLLLKLISDEEFADTAPSARQAEDYWSTPVYQEPLRKTERGFNATGHHFSTDTGFLDMFGRPTGREEPTSRPAPVPGVPTHPPVSRWSDGTTSECSSLDRYRDPRYVACVLCEVADSGVVTRSTLSDLGNSQQSMALNKLSLDTSSTVWAVKNGASICVTTLPKQGSPPSEAQVFEMLNKVWKPTASEELQKVKDQVSAQTNVWGATGKTMTIRRWSAKFTDGNPDRLLVVPGTPVEKFVNSPAGGHGSVDSVEARFLYTWVDMPYNVNLEMPSSSNKLQYQEPLPGSAIEPILVEHEGTAEKKPPAKLECGKPNTKYDPWDNVGVSDDEEENATMGPSEEESAGECQLKCQYYDGCEYFSYLKDTKMCHLSSQEAELVDTHFNIVTAPQFCPEEPKEPVVVVEDPIVDLGSGPSSTGTEVEVGPFTETPSACFRKIDGLGKKQGITSLSACQDLCSSNAKCFGVSYSTAGGWKNTCFLAAVADNPKLETPCKSSSTWSAYKRNGMTITLEGKIGDELVKITSGTFVKQVGPIPKIGMTVQVPEPEKGMFTIEFLNDDGPKDVFFTNYGWDITFPAQWDGWACGSSSPNTRCDVVKGGHFAWNGVYVLKRQVTCPSGYTHTKQNVDGGGKSWSFPGKTIGACKAECEKRIGCTSFEYNSGGDENYKCGTYTGGSSNVKGTQANGWTTCLRDSSLAPAPTNRPTSPPTLGTCLKNFNVESDCAWLNDRGMKKKWTQAAYQGQTCEERAAWWSGQFWHQCLKGKTGLTYPGTQLTWSEGGTKFEVTMQENVCLKNFNVESDCAWLNDRGMKNKWTQAAYEGQTCEERAAWWSGQFWHQCLKGKGGLTYPGTQLTWSEGGTKFEVTMQAPAPTNRPTSPPTLGTCLKNFNVESDCAWLNDRGMKKKWTQAAYQGQTCEQRAAWWSGQFWHQCLNGKTGLTYPGTKLTWSAGGTKFEVTMLVGLKNAGVNCWNNCGSKSGTCSFCGTGKCCRRGYWGDRGDCGWDEGGSWHHACVARSSGRRRGEEDAQYAPSIKMEVVVAVKDTFKPEKPAVIYGMKSVGDLRTTEAGRTINFVGSDALASAKRFRIEGLIPIVKERLGLPLPDTLLGMEVSLMEFGYSTEMDAVCLKAVRAQAEEFSVEDLAESMGFGSICDSIGRLCDFALSDFGVQVDFGESYGRGCPRKFDGTRQLATFFGRPKGIDKVGGENFQLSIRPGLGSREHSLSHHYYGRSTQSWIFLFNIPIEKLGKKLTDLTGLSFFEFLTGLIASTGVKNIGISISNTAFTAGGFKNNGVGLEVDYTAANSGIAHYTASGGKGFSLPMFAEGLQGVNYMYPLYMNNGLNIFTLIQVDQCEEDQYICRFIGLLTMGRDVFLEGNIPISSINDMMKTPPPAEAVKEGETPAPEENNEENNEESGGQEKRRRSGERVNGEEIEEALQMLERSRRYARLVEDGTLFTRSRHEVEQYVRRREDANGGGDDKKDAGGSLFPDELVANFQATIVGKPYHMFPPHGPMFHRNKMFMSLSNKKQSFGVMTTMTIPALPEIEFTGMLGLTLGPVPPTADLGLGMATSNAEEMWEGAFGIPQLAIESMTAQGSIGLSYPPKPQKIAFTAKAMISTAGKLSYCTNPVWRKQRDDEWDQNCLEVEGGLQLALDPAFDQWAYFKISSITLGQLIKIFTGIDPKAIMPESLANSGFTPPPHRTSWPGLQMSFASKTFKSSSDPFLAATLPVPFTVPAGLAFRGYLSIFGWRGELELKVDPKTLRLKVGVQVSPASFGSAMNFGPFLKITNMANPALGPEFRFDVCGKCKGKTPLEAFEFMLSGKLTIGNFFTFGAHIKITSKFGGHFFIWIEQKIWEFEITGKIEAKNWKGMEYWTKGRTLAAYFDFDTVGLRASIRNALKSTNDMLTKETEKWADWLGNEVTRIAQDIESVSDCAQKCYNKCKYLETPEEEKPHDVEVYLNPACTWLGWCFSGRRRVDPNFRADFIDMDALGKTMDKITRMPRGMSEEDVLYYLGEVGQQYQATAVPSLPEDEFEEEERAARFIEWEKKCNAAHSNAWWCSVTNLNNYNPLEALKKVDEFIRNPKQKICEDACNIGCVGKNVIDTATKDTLNIAKFHVDTYNTFVDTIFKALDTLVDNMIWDVKATFDGEISGFRKEVRLYLFVETKNGKYEWEHTVDLTFGIPKAAMSIMKSLFTKHHGETPDQMKAEIRDEAHKRRRQIPGAEHHTEAEDFFRREKFLHGMEPLDW